MKQTNKSLSTRPYVIGFITSLALTLGSYTVVTQNALNRRTILVIIFAFAFIQFVIQLVYFLHLGAESKPRWKQLVFWMMILVVFILVAGSIWIMNNLNYHMSLQQMYQYLNNQSDGL